MINPIILDILVRRILEGGINPKTNQPMKLEDINEPYRTVVENEILIKQQVV